MDDITPVATTPDVPAVGAIDPVTPDAEAQEWDDATNELFPGIKTDKKEPKKDESVKSSEDPAATSTPNPDETPEQKTARESKEAEDGAATEAREEDESASANARDSRLAAREFAAASEEVKTDVRKQMFADVPTEMRDRDGDPIKSVEDVMKLINPRTNEPFTEEEAGSWLSAAQKTFNENLASVEKQIDQIAEVNVILKDHADSVKFEYGELLKALPELRDSLWASYEGTLVKDEKSGIITKAPISLEKFYRGALEPYAKLARNMEAAETEKAAVAVADAAKTEDNTQRQRQQSRSDRSDIYSGGKVDTRSAEDKEWSEAATAVFGPLK